MKKGEKKGKKDKVEEAAAKVKVELRRDLVNRLIQRKKVGDSYTSVIERLLNDTEKREKG